MDINMERKVRLQRSFFRICFALSVVLALGGMVLNFYLYTNCYDSQLGVMAKGMAMNTYYILCAVVILSAILMSALPIFKNASKTLPSSSGFGILANSFCGFFLIAYVVLQVFEYRDNGVQIPVWLWLMSFCAVIGSLYFHYQTISARPNKMTLALFGMFLLVFNVINIYAVHYTAKGILINSPVKIGSLIAMTAALMFIVNEIRYHFNIANPNAYFGFSIACFYFALPTVLQRSILQ